MSCCPDIDFFCPVIDRFSDGHLGFIFLPTSTNWSDFWYIKWQRICLPMLKISGLQNHLFGCYRCPDIKSSGNRLMTLVIRVLCYTDT